MPVRPTHLALAFGVVAALALAACGDDDGGSSADTSAAATSAAATTAGAAATSAAGEEEEGGAETITVSESDLGQILTDGEGHTVYLFLNDTANSPSTCVDACADNWPPVATEGDPVATGGVDATMLGTVTRDDGTVQVTYGGLPLYYFAPDTAVGDTNGQGVGQVWYVLGADGEAITTAP